MRQHYCAICGGPMVDSGWRDDPTDEPTRWLSHAIGLTTAHKIEDGLELDEYFPGPRYYGYALGPRIPEEADRSVIRVQVNTYDEGTQFRLRNTDQYIIPFYVNIPAKPGGYTSGGPLYIIMHDQCLKVADRYIDSVDTTGYQAEDRITSVKQLWEVLYHRIPGSKGSPSERAIDEPHDYFGGRNCRNCYWAPEDDEPHAEIHESSPINIPNLTTSILKNLKPLPPGRQFHNPPPEPSTNFTHNFLALDLDCEYTQSHSWWCTALLNKKIFPWLWDLDIEVVRTKQLESDEWDWELLVRQLSQVRIHEPGDEVIDIPLQLKNRRRIWRLLEEARVGDISIPAEERIRAVIAERDRIRDLRWSEMNSGAMNAMS